MYKLRYTSAAKRFFKKIKQKGLRDSFQNALERIFVDPFSGDKKSGDLSGLYGYDVYFNKTNYEIAYLVQQNEQGIVVVVLAGTRENFYQELKRVIKSYDIN